MLHAVQHVNGRVLWANLHLLFWLSLIPFVTGWMGENHFAPDPVAPNVWLACALYVLVAMSGSSPIRGSSTARRNDAGLCRS